MAEKTIQLDILLNIKPDDINSVKELKTTLRDLRSAALSVEEGSEAFNKITAKAGQLNDKIKDLNEVIGAQTGDRLENTSKAFVKFGQIGLGAFQTVQGAAALFGAESEDLQKTLVKLNAAMALGQGLAALAEVPGELNKISAALKLTTAQANLLKTAIAGVGIAGLAIGLAYLTAEFLNNTEAMRKNTEQQKLYAEQVDKASQFIAKEYVEINRLLDVAKNETLSRKSRKTALDELQKKYPDYLNNLTIETINTEKGTKAINDMTQSIIKRGLVMAAQDSLQKEYKVLFENYIKLQRIASDENIPSFMKEKFIKTFGENIRNAKDNIEDVQKFLSENKIEADFGLGDDKTKKITDNAEKVTKSVGVFINSIQPKEGPSLFDWVVKGIDDTENLTFAYESYSDKIVEGQDSAREEIQKTINLENEAAQNKINNTQAAFNVTSSFIALGEALFAKSTKDGEKLSVEAQKKAFQRSKALALVNATINGAQAITSIIGQYPKFDGGFAMIAALASASAAIIAQIAVISKQKFSPDSSNTSQAPSANISLNGGNGGTINGFTPATPSSFALFGTGGQSNQGGAVDNTGVGAQRVYVLESDITNTQNRVVSLVAEIG
jgi:hypothetical protein